jgi:hypothetical protein
MPKLGAAPTEYPGIGLVYSGGISIFTQVLCDAYLGTMTARVGGGVTAPGQTWVEDAGLNWRFHLTFDNNATLNNVIAALMYGSVNTDGSATWVTSTTNTTTSTFLFIQVEEWPDGTSYIPTAGATVQRVDEILTITPCPVTKDFTFYMEFVPTIDWSDIDAGFVRLFGSDDSGGDELRTIGGVGWSWTVFGGGGLLVIKQTDFVKDSVYKIAVSVRQDGANEITNLFVNGVVQIDNESDAGTLDHSDVDLDIGFYDPGLQGTCPMKVKDFAVWDYAKPPADLLILSGG